MAFSGTVEKCKACDKTVHIIDLLTADGVSYHKTCFKCSHCNGLLVMSSYSSMDGVLYCKPHFEQLFKGTGSFSKKSGASDKANALAKTPSKLSLMFSGTQDKCSTCNKTVYPLEKVTVEGEFFHKSCFRCSHGGCFLTPSNYAALDGTLYCKHHFAQLFKEKGSYAHVSKSISMKRDAAAAAAAAATEEAGGEEKSETGTDEDPKPETEQES